MSSIHVHGEEVGVVVLGIKRIFDVRTVVSVVIDTTQDELFQQGTEEQVIVSVRPGSRGNCVDLAVDGSHWILGLALLEGLDVRHQHGQVQGGLLRKHGGFHDVDPEILVGPVCHQHGQVQGGLLRKHGGFHDVDPEILVGPVCHQHGQVQGGLLRKHGGFHDVDPEILVGPVCHQHGQVQGGLLRKHGGFHDVDPEILVGPVCHQHGQVQGGLLRKHGGFHDVDPVISVGPVCHQRERVLASHQSYLDINVIDQELILQEQVHEEAAHHVNDVTPVDLRSSSHEPFIRCVPVRDLYGVHVSGRVLVPQLTRHT